MSSLATRTAASFFCASITWVQDAYVRMVERPPHFRSGIKLQAWLAIVMRHTWADRFPRHKIEDPAFNRLLRRAALRGGCGKNEFLFAAGAEDTLDEPPTFNEQVV